MPTHRLHTDTEVKQPRNRVRNRLVRSELVASTRADAKLMQSVLVSYTPNRISQSLKVLKIK